MHRRITRRTFLPLVLLAAVDLQSPTVSERTDSRSGQPAPSPAAAMLVATTSQATRDLLLRGRRQFDAADLDKPTLAVEFGAWYLANQLRAFGGDPFRALAAYNAGASPVARWNASGPDLFVERIDYPETRNYVREVYPHHAIYRRLLGQSGVGD